MDKKDKKILAELLHNSRISLTQLAKKTMISRELLHYRLKKLEKNIIIRYSTQINLKLLGFKRTGCYISLKNSSLKFEKKFLEFLKQHQQIAGISTNIGKYDFIVDLFYKEELELQKISREIETYLQNRCNELFFINIPIEQAFFHNKLIELTPQKNINKRKIFKTDIKIDKTDKLILQMLNQNARQSLVNISKECHLNSNAIGYRIKNLERLGVISHSTIFLDLNSLDYALYNIQIKLRNSLSSQKILSFLKQHPNTFYYYHYYGNKDWDIDIGAFIKRKSELKGLFRDLKNNYGNEIEFKETYIVEELFKEELPKIIFK